MENSKLASKVPYKKPPPHPSGSQLPERAKLGLGADEEVRHSTFEQAGGLESAKALLEQLKSVVDDAVFLDGDTFAGMKDIAHYSQKLQHGQAAQKRIKSLNQQLLASQIQLARKDEHIKQVKLEKQQVEEQVQDLQQSLDNNQVVFKVHYKEILQRNAEIERLKSVIEGLGAAGITQ